MKIVIQRVLRANVRVEEKEIGAIQKGLLIFLGIGNEDTKEDCKRFADKIINLRIFEDEQGKTNLSLSDVEGELMVISQFTLYADCKKGNRPSFIQAGKPDLAKELYEYFIEYCKEKIGNVAHGSFGADMKIELVNDGPFTIVLDETSVTKK